MSWIDDPELLGRERDRLPAPGLPTWIRFAPVDVLASPELAAIAAYLGSEEARLAIDAAEAQEAYPREALDELWERGFAELLCEAGAYPLTALNALTAPLSGGLAVTVGVNALALIAPLIGADDEQWAAIQTLVRARTSACMALTELEHGSNLLRTDARAEPGRLDAAGAFVPVRPGDGPTHYRLSGEKHLINGGREHGLIVVLLRTRTKAAAQLPTESNPFATRGAHSVFWLTREQTVVGTPRWATLPAQTADISGLRFEDTLVPCTQRLAAEGEGFRLVQKTLVGSRGGVSGLASGSATAARDLAWSYARRRDVYGQPIAALGGVAEHLLRVDALDRLAAAASLRAMAWVNAAGPKAACYTAVAKFASCRLAERAVDEARCVLGGRALLRQLPFERLSRDVLLYGVFDGTSHVMLDELQGHLATRAREWRDDERRETLKVTRQVYGAPARRLREAMRARSRLRALPLEQNAKALATLPGALDLEPLRGLCAALLETSASLIEAGPWHDDQGLRFELAEVYAQAEALLALVELFDPDRRPFLVDRQATTTPLDALGYRHAISWVGGQLCSRLAEVQASYPQVEFADVRPGGLAQLLGELRRDHARHRRALIAAIQTA